jgi:Holliday junction resolvase RusA-like endonuclease
VANSAVPGAAKSMWWAGMSYVLQFELPGLPRTTNGSHGHWRTKAASVKKWKQAVFTKAWPRRPTEPLACAIITFTRCSSVEPDFDNLVISFKACMDGLRQAKIIVDDKKKNVGRPEYLWEYAPKGQGKIKIKIEQAIGGQKENT